jgi:hypothetical protein
MSGAGLAHFVEANGLPEVFHGPPAVTVDFAEVLGVGLEGQTSSTGLPLQPGAWSAARPAATAHLASSRSPGLHQACGPRPGWYSAGSSSAQGALPSLGLHTLGREGARAAPDTSSWWLRAPCGVAKWQEAAACHPAGWLAACRTGSSGRLESVVSVQGLGPRSPVWPMPMALAVRRVKVQAGRPCPHW